jgi:hypothetical protein
VCFTYHGFAVKPRKIVVSRQNHGNVVSSVTVENHCFVAETIVFQNAAYPTFSPLKSWYWFCLVATVVFWAVSHHLKQKQWFQKLWFYKTMVLFFTMIDETHPNSYTEFVATTVPLYLLIFNRPSTTRATDDTFNDFERS